MKFINRRTGCILEPGSIQVEEQLRVNPEYSLWNSEELLEAELPQEDSTPKESRAGNGTAKMALAKMSKSELMDAAKAAGIVVAAEATKSEIIALLQTDGEG